MTNYHYNPVNGKTGKCDATVKPCRYGQTQEQHGESPGQARANYERSMESELLPAAVSTTVNRPVEGDVFVTVRNSYGEEVEVWSSDAGRSLPSGSYAGYYYDEQRDADVEILATVDRQGAMTVEENLGGFEPEQQPDEVEDRRRAVEAAHSTLNDMGYDIDRLDEFAAGARFRGDYDGALESLRRMDSSDPVSLSQELDRLEMHSDNIRESAHEATGDPVNDERRLAFSERFADAVEELREECFLDEY